MIEALAIIIPAILATIGGGLAMSIFYDSREILKGRKQPESKTPYDYALTNAINERDRLQDELVTIKALKRTEEDTERIRNEIGTILSDGGEDATEGVYEPNIGMPIQDNGDGTFSPITWDNRISSGEMVDNISKAVARANGTNVREDEAFSPTSWDARMSLEEWAKGVSKAFASGYANDDESEGVCGVIEHTVTAGETITQIARNYGVRVWDIVENNDLLKYADLKDHGIVCGQTLKIRDIVREDDSEDEQSTEDDVERSLTEVVKESFENNDGIRVFWEDSHGRTRAHYGSINEIETANGKVIYFSVWGLGVSARDVLRITKGRDTDGETLYRKGNR